MIIGFFQSVGNVPVLKDRFTRKIDLLDKQVNPSLGEMTGFL